MAHAFVQSKFVYCVLIVKKAHQGLVKVQPCSSESVTRLRAQGAVSQKVIADRGRLVPFVH